MIKILFTKSHSIIHILIVLNAGLATCEQQSFLLVVCVVSWVVVLVVVEIVVTIVASLISVLVVVVVSVVVERFASLIVVKTSLTVVVVVITVTIVVASALSIIIVVITIVITSTLTIIIIETIVSSSSIIIPTFELPVIVPLFKIPTSLPVPELPISTLISSPITTWFIPTPVIMIVIGLISVLMMILLPLFLSLRPFVMIFWWTLLILTWLCRWVTPSFGLIVCVWSLWVFWTVGSCSFRFSFETGNARFLTAATVLALSRCLSWVGFLLWWRWFSWLVTCRSTWLRRVFTFLWLIFIPHLHVFTPKWSILPQLCRIIFSAQTIRWLTSLITLIWSIKNRGDASFIELTFIIAFQLVLIYFLDNCIISKRIVLLGWWGRIEKSVSFEQTYLMLQRDDFTFEVFVLCLFENRLLLVIITLVT